MCALFPTLRLNIDVSWGKMNRVENPDKANLESHSQLRSTEDTFVCMVRGCRHTVCFFSFGIFYDGITQKVLKIIEFGKEFLKDIGNAFCDV